VTRGTHPPPPDPPAGPQFRKGWCDRTHFLGTLESARTSVRPVGLLDRPTCEATCKATVQGSEARLIGNRTEVGAERSNVSWGYIMQGALLCFQESCREAEPQPSPDGLALVPLLRHRELSQYRMEVA
jgi:hypothetical protein